MFKGYISASSSIHTVRSAEIFTMKSLQSDGCHVSRQLVEEKEEVLHSQSISGLICLHVGRAQILRGNTSVHRKLFFMKEVESQLLEKWLDLWGDSSCRVETQTCQTSSEQTSTITTPTTCRNPRKVSWWMCEVVFVVLRMDSQDSVPLWSQQSSRSC